MVNKNNGVAIIVALLLIGLILSIAVLLISSGLSEGHIARNEIYDYKSFYLAESARQNALGYLNSISFNIPDVYSIKPWRKCEKKCSNSVKFDDSVSYKGVYEFSISDEESKININTSNQQILSNLFKALKIKGYESKSQKIIDERQRNGEFINIVEVLNNKTVSLQDYYVLKDYISVMTSDDNFLPLDVSYFLNSIGLGKKELNLLDKLFDNKKININDIPSLSIYELGNKQNILTAIKTLTKLHLLSNIEGDIIRLENTIFSDIGFGPLDIKFKKDDIFPQKDDALDIVLYGIFLKNSNNVLVKWLLKMMGSNKGKNSYENIIDLLDVPPITPMISCIDKVIQVLSIFLGPGKINILKISKIIKALDECDSAAKLSMGANLSECLVGWLGISADKAKLLKLPQPKSCPTENAEKSITLDELKIIAPFITVKETEAEGVINLNTAEKEVLYSVLRAKFSEQRTKEIIDFVVDKRDNLSKLNFDKKIWKSSDSGGLLGEFTNNVGYLYFMDVTMLIKEDDGNEGLSTDEYRLVADSFTVRSNGYRIYTEGKLIPDEKEKSFSILNSDYYGKHNLFSKVDVSKGKIKSVYFQSIPRNFDFDNEEYHF